MNHAAELSYTPNAASSGPAQPEPIPTHPPMTTAPQPITLTIPAASQQERLEILETIVEKGIDTVFEIGAALEEIRDHKLFRPQFSTFGQYLEKRWNWTRARCYQLIGATQVRDNLSTHVDNIAQLTEPHCRVLAKLTDEEQVTAWKEATSAEPDGQVRLAHLKDAAAKLRPPAPPMTLKQAPATAVVVVEAAEDTDDHALPAQSLEEPAGGQPGSPPATAPATIAADGFDLDAEWTVVEETLTSLFRRCPKCRWPMLWKKLNAYSERHSERIVTAVSHTKCGEPRSAQARPPRVMIAGQSCDSHPACDDPHLTLIRLPSLLIAGAKYPIPQAEVAVGAVPLARYLRDYAMLAEDWSRADCWGSARKLYERCIERLTNEEGVNPEYRDKQLPKLQHAANRCYVLEHLIPEGSTLPDTEVQKLVSILNRAALPQVLEFRQRIESGADLLDLTQEILALAAPVEAVPAQPTPPASSPPVTSVSGPDAEPTDHLY